MCGRGISHQVQHAFTSGTYYNWAATEPLDPRELQIKTEPTTEGGAPIYNKVMPEALSKLSIIAFGVKAKSHALKGIKYVDAYVKVYSWIWRLCTQATRDKLKTVPDFTDIERKKDFIELTIAIKGVTL